MSWIVTRKSDGAVIGEFYNRKTLDQFNPEKVSIQTAKQYLQTLNAGIRAQSVATKRQHNPAKTTIIRRANPDYEKHGAWSRFSVSKRPSGWRVEFHSQISGSLTGTIVIVPFSTRYPKDLILSAPWNEWLTNGEAIATAAQEGLRENKIKPYHRGTKVR